jgi:glycerol-3-phosphate acyltransferase PlsY
MHPVLHISLISSILVLTTAFATRNFRVVLIVILTFQALILPVWFGFRTWTLAASGSALLYFAVVLHYTIRKRNAAIRNSDEIKVWRIIARPFALLFIPVRHYIGLRFLLYLLGGLSLLFIATDLYRLISRTTISSLFKRSEQKRFSSMSSFLVAIFIVFLLFPPEVSYLCLCFIIFGDMAAKMTGARFGRTVIIHGRTLEGSLGFLTACLYSGYILCIIFEIPVSYLAIGAFAATLTELFSHHVDDNFTVGLITGGCLQALKYFLII